jgi:tRNA 2-selenouridine synthase
MSELPIEEFLKAPGPIFDVRSPCEFAHGHIPGAISLPLFSDDERAQVGTVYKQNSKEAAIQLGLKFAGLRLPELAKTILKESPKGECRVTCFRGGMRSKSMEWLAGLLGLSTVRLEGGYKSYRKYVLDVFERSFTFFILGGFTGSGKTEEIQKLSQKGYQAIDLEALACHKGSAFGLAPDTQQPSTEHFENLLAHSLCQCDPEKPIFLEDESRRIGSCTLPGGIYEKMDKAQLFWLEVDFEKRLERVLTTYGSYPVPWLIEQTKKLQKRLGGERTTTIVSSLQDNRIKDAAAELLKYYDVAYQHSRSRHCRNEIRCENYQNKQSVVDYHDSLFATSFQ